jgi:CxxC motif-containing protein (DUF1111 family)
MIGLGLLQAIPQDDIATLADPQDQNGDGISGRVNMVWDNSLQTGVPGRFGWKASQPNLRQQNASAAIGDIGLTTSLAIAENCTGTETLCAQAMSGGAPEINDEFLEKLTLYTMTLAVPAQRNADAENITAGARHFAEMGCMSCHVPSFTTSKVEGFPELSDQKIHPFTDLLLHDMGPALSDDRPDFDAQGSEWRTPPLWGLGLYPVVGKHNFLLHDGRARNISEAILWHDGEARHSRDMFRQAPRKIRDELLAFLSSI